MSEVPPEVTAAAGRISGAMRQALEEHPVVRVHEIPPVFRAIIDNYNRRHEILRIGPEMTRDDWRELGRLRQDLKTNLIPSAERALAWNTDKGQG